MTETQMRDHFAGLAMQAILSRVNLPDCRDGHPGVIPREITHAASLAYLVAEAMLRTRGGPSFPAWP